MADIGTTLREARIRARIDISEVEARTKIRAKYLRAIENEEWDLLPGEVYVRSFLRTYADFLGLDSRALLDEFRRRYESPSDHEPPPIAPPGRERRDRERRRQSGGPIGIPPWLIVLVVLVIVAAVLYIVGKNNGSSPGNSAGVHHTTTTKQRHHHPRHHARHHHAVTTHPKVPNAVTVSLTATSAVSSFICLENAHGRHLVDGNYAVGQPIPSGTAKKLLLTVESPTVTIKANGKTIANTVTSAPVTYRILPTGHSVITTTTPNMTCGT